MKIINIPIEPIENRYSKQWDGWFLREFGKEKNISVQTIYGGTTSGKINEGSFLDICETNRYKTQQLLEILDILTAYKDKHKLVLFFHDLWFPGLETIAYIREGRGLKNLRICGCLHAGSYDPFDFLHKTGMTPWALHMEKGWFNSIVDQIFVATEYHKSILFRTRISYLSKDKIQVTGFPMYSEEFVLPGKKENTVIFPHRLDSEKQPELFDKLAGVLPPGYKLIKTAEVCGNDKQLYYHLLSTAKVAVSFALQETWGIAMQEAFFSGCIPLVPYRLSYREMYNSTCFYKQSEVVQKIRHAVEFYDDIYKRLRPLQVVMKWSNETAIEKMIHNMKSL